LPSLCSCLVKRNIYFSTCTAICFIACCTNEQMVQLYLRPPRGAIFPFISSLVKQVTFLIFFPPIRGISDLGRGHVFVSVVPPKITAGGEVRGRIDTSPRSQQMMMERLHHHRRRNDLFTPPPPKRECTAECGGPSVVTTS
jgi:hypothetical protein